MFKCELCLYSTDRQANLNRHFETKKHIIRAHNKSIKNNTCDFIYNKEKTISKTYEEIKNFEKNGEKKGENFLGEIDKFSNSLQVSEIKSQKNNIFRDKYLG